MLFELTFFDALIFSPMLEQAAGGTSEQQLPLAAGTSDPLTEYQVTEEYCKPWGLTRATGSGEREKGRWKLH